MRLDLIKAEPHHVVRMMFPRVMLSCEQDLRNAVIAICPQKTDEGMLGNSPSDSPIMSVTPGAHDANETEGRSNSASGARPKSVRFGDEVAAVEPQPQSKAAASFEEPTESDFENAQVGSASCCSRVSRWPRMWHLVRHSCRFKSALWKEGEDTEMLPC